MTPRANESKSIPRSSQAFLSRPEHFKNPVIHGVFFCADVPPSFNQPRISPKSRRQIRTPPSPMQRSDTWSPASGAPRAALKSPHQAHLRHCLTNSGVARLHLLHLAKLRATEAFDVASIFTWDEATEASLDSAQLASVSGKAHGYPGIGHRCELGENLYSRRSTPPPHQSRIASCSRFVQLLSVRP